MDTRNVIDYYKYWKTEAIKADLDDKRHNFSVLISNQFNDFNIATVIRNCNAFLAKEVIIYGNRRYIRKGTVGTHNYENFRYVKVVEELKFNCPVIGVDNIPEAKIIQEYDFPKEEFVIVLGQEDIGIPEELKKLCNDFVYIKQFGSVRSLNVGCASAIALYEITRGM